MRCRLEYGREGLEIDLPDDFGSALAAEPTALAFYESGGEYDDKYVLEKAMRPSSLDRRAECIAELRALIAHDEILRQLCLDFAPRRRATRSKNDYAFEKKIAAIVGGALAIPPVDARELHEMIALIAKPASP